MLGDAIAIEIPVAIPVVLMLSVGIDRVVSIRGCGDLDDFVRRHVQGGSVEDQDPALCMTGLAQLEVQIRTVGQRSLQDDRTR